MIKKLYYWGILLLAGCVIGGIISIYAKDIYQKQNPVTDSHLQKRDQYITKIVSILEGTPQYLNMSQIQLPQEGQEYATIHNDARGFSKPLYFGDSEAILDIAIGQYAESGYPGQGKPLLLAGHNGTHFVLLPSFEMGDIVQIDTSYGSYKYEIYDSEIMYVDEFDSSILDKKEEILILYTCYPFDIIGTDQRYFVYAKYVDGPKLIDDRNEGDKGWKD